VATGGKAAAKPDKKAFFQELKNRQVYGVAIAHGIAGSAVFQVMGTVLPVFNARDDPRFQKLSALTPP
jgi:hypothetical protein